MSIRNLAYACVAKILPIWKDTWVFSSFNGDYSDSPRAISELLNKMRPSTRIVWIAKSNGTFPEYVKRIRPNTLKAECAKRCGRVLVDNVYADVGFSSDNDSFSNKMKLLLWLRRKKGQHVYTTWHGLPLKKIGRDQIGNDYREFLTNDLTMFVNSKYEEDIMRHVTFGKVKINRLGMPRNDALFNSLRGNEIKKKLGIDTTKKVIMFAPTFRNDGKATEARNVQRSGIDQINELDLDNLFNSLNVKFGGEWVFICRFHYFVNAQVNWEELNRKYPGQIINGNMLSDMADYLTCADILLTDASSCMFDFALTRRPCFIYFPDLENYQNVERGFYVPVESLPFPVARTSKELVEKIRDFDADKYMIGIETMIKEFEIVDDGHAAERILDYIEKDCKE